MKATNSAVLAMSDMFRAVAGAPDAQYDMIACAVYSAAFSIMQAGNKTQFNKLQADASMYGSDSTEATKAIKAALGATKMTPAVKHYRKVYFSVGVALDQCGIPADMQKELPKGKAEIDAILAPLADAYSQEFASIFHATVTMPEKTEEQRAEESAKRALAKAEKEKLAAELAIAGEAALQAQVREEAARMVDGAALASVPTLAEMARMVALALASGELDADVEAEMLAAAQTRGTAVLLAGVMSSAALEPETV